MSNDSERFDPLGIEEWPLPMKFAFLVLLSLPVFLSQPLRGLLAGFVALYEAVGPVAFGGIVLGTVAIAAVVDRALDTDMDRSGGGD